MASASPPARLCRAASAAQTCRADGDCGADGLCLLGSAQVNICFHACADDAGCREGWSCQTDVEDPTLTYCLPDCRQVGCGRGLDCGDDGACVPRPIPCPYACQAGEACDQGHCVRNNGTCVTAYHCAEGEQCTGGRCVTAALSSCVNDGECAAGLQTCAPRSQNPLDGGVCLFTCVLDDDCDLDLSCYAEFGNACWYRFCGSDYGNGQALGPCDAGAEQQWPGSCLPVPGGGLTQGVCLEAGTAEDGAACDAQAEGRDEASRALTCAPGLYCIDDPDDPIDPAAPQGRGHCTAYCNPGAQACTEGRSCIDYSTFDDPATPADDGRTLGFCQESDCTMAGACAAGDLCRPHALTSDLGHCTPRGRVAVDQPCAGHDECADTAYCANAGDGPVCLRVCFSEDDDRCDEGSTCLLREGWAFGVCL